MKIGAWHSRGVYPLDTLEKDGLFSLWMRDDLGETSDRVLLRGISGMGKSTLLRGISHTFSCLDALLAGANAPKAWGNTALRIEGLGTQPVLLCLVEDAAFFDTVRALHPDALAVGWRGGEAVLAEDAGRVLRQAFSDAQARPNMLLISDDPDDALRHDGGIAAPSVDLGDVSAYIRASGGYAETLSAMQQAHPGRLSETLSCLNALFHGKQIDPADAFQVTTSRGTHHSPEKLSAGERRMLLMLVAVGLVLHPGGILLVDEPESHIHPSQTLGVLSTLEAFALRGNGQLILTSHMPEVWRRYENLGLALSLEEAEA